MARRKMELVDRPVVRLIAYLCAERDLSRSELARRAGLSAAGAVAVLREMVTEGLLNERVAPSEAGGATRMFRLTARGRALLDALDMDPAEYERATWDVFISHASEDKNDFVRPLARALSDAGVRTWF